MGRKKKAVKGFKVQDSFVCRREDHKQFLLSFVSQKRKTVKKTAEGKDKFYPKLQYCPKIPGCCYAYQKEDKKNAS